QWVLQDGIAYLFPQSVKINASNQSETGSWYKINHQSDSPKDLITKDVFKIWINHGVKPANATYQYIVVPSTNEKELTEQGDRKLMILSNTAEIQAVQHTGLNIIEMIFYHAGQIKLSGDLKIGMDSPGLVMVKMDRSKLKTITVADPSRKLGRIHLTVSDKKGLNFASLWNNEKGNSEITIDLPQTVYAGKSVTIEL
ncbi:MAG: chondroitin lyase, partial [Mariniphaga sp.]|nr:chondroitin lyase [Mariniphaga sp.]